MKTHRPRRNPDGTPAIRSVDDLLAAAAAPEAIQHLPGKGQPLDLAGYFRADPEQRMAGRLLRDNDILPQPLQDRRDAEIARHRAEDALTRAGEDLARQRHRIEQWGACVATMIAAPGLPDDLLPGAVSLLTPVDPAPAEQLKQELDVYSQRRRQARERVRQLAEAADALAGSLNEQIMLSRHLPAQLQVSHIDIAGILDRFDAAAPDLPSLPDLNSNPRAPSSWWRRFLWKERSTRS